MKGYGVCYKRGDGRELAYPGCFTEQQAQNIVDRIGPEFLHVVKYGDR